MKKRNIFLICLSPILLILALVVFLLTPLSMPLIKMVAVKTVPDLHINELSGSLTEELNIGGLEWENDAWQVKLDKGYVKFQFSCFFAPQICIDRLFLSGVDVKQLAVTEEESKEPAAESIELPFPIGVQAFDFNNIAIELVGQTIKLKQLKGRGSVHTRVKLAGLQGENLIIAMDAASTDEPAPSEQPTNYALSYTPPQLPEIKTPIPIEINSFGFKSVTLKTGETAHVINQIKFKRLGFEQHDVLLKELFVKHQLATLQLNLTATLKENYRIDLLAGSKIMAQDINQTLQLDIDGALNNLTVDLMTEGTYQANANLQVNLLNDELPLSLNLSWPEQAIAALPDSILHKGTLNLQGKIGAYQLAADTAVTTPQTGNIPALVDATITKNNVTMNKLTLKLLDGEVNNTGTLFLSDTISWQGDTQVVAINTTSLIPQGPTDVNGNIPSLLQYSAKGLEISIADLNLSATQADIPLSLTGSVVYSEPSDLIVSTGALTQQDNVIRFAGQLLKQRYLTADVFIDIAKINSLYSGASGSIRGKIDASGNWQNPKAQANLALSEVRLSPTVSSFMAEQGPLNGDLKVEGELTEHTIAIDLGYPEHNVMLAMEGKWKHDTQSWGATVKSSEVEAFNTQWSLQSNFDVAFKSDPLIIKATENCWFSRKEGQLCMKDLLYRNKKGFWNIDAKGLPLGLWAHELLPDVFPNSPASMLSIQSVGNYGQGSPLDADFTIKVTPAKWTLGTTNPVTLTLNNVSVIGEAVDDELTAKMRVTSPELGEFKGNINLSPLSAEGNFDGRVFFNDINVAPLKPISPAIRELSGNLNGQIALAGQLNDLSLNGEIDLKNGAMNVEDAPVTISNWQQHIELNGRKATFDGEFMLGEGKGSLTGDVDWSGSPELNVALKGERFDVKHSQATLKVSPDIVASVKPGKVKVTGDVNIPWARIEVEELPENAVAPSDDVYLRGEPPRDDPLDIIDASVQVKIDEAKRGEVKLDAFGLTANLHGSIRVNTVPAVVGYGDLQILDGRYEAYGQNLLIQTGEVQFNGPLDQPFLLIEAIRSPDKTADGVIAGIRIDGAADSPNVNLFSTPSMNQGAVLSYLLNGRGPDSEKQDPNYEALLVGFGLSRTTSLTNQVGESLGIDNLSIGTTSSPGGNDTKLSVTGQINEKLSIEYNFDVGLSKEDSSSQALRRRQGPPDLAVRYDLTPNLFLEAVQATIEQQSEYALDIYYEFFLGKKEKPALEEELKTEQ
ncbi:translocation/assembly module TamB domain-containing protein [Alteromonas sp. ASW11-130]|uniref:translocation/assembly module TamB domain-containing protein n=1 Tax=Alteromonas sp. ASW11-130 TaxID=3015775 RepID=UPI002241D4C9|nr:translocation/assembly module TamB domain-containing protein [Alteromonas sp. ASW11-130]MCW8093359.1 translocation/assembly module TamB domain-containing protein [Alteromonas sp. ASW11-130]